MELFYCLCERKSINKKEESEGIKPAAIYLQTSYKNKKEKSGLLEASWLSVRLI